MLKKSVLLKDAASAAEVRFFAMRRLFQHPLKPTSSRPERSSPVFPPCSCRCLFLVGITGADRVKPSSHPAQNLSSTPQLQYPCNQHKTNRILSTGVWRFSSCPSVKLKEQARRSPRQITGGFLLRRNIRRNSFRKTTLPVNHLE